MDGALIGVFTAGESGESREYRFHGIDEWDLPRRVWETLADLDQLGLFAFGDSSRWEVRISGLAANRTDGRGRAIDNALIFRGQVTDTKADQRPSSSLAFGLARLVLQDATALESEVASRLTPPVVEAWFADPDLASADAPGSVSEVLRGLVEPLPFEGGPDIPESCLLGARQQGAQQRILSSLAALARGTPGIAAIGSPYVDGGEEADFATKRVLGLAPRTQFVIIGSLESEADPVRLKALDPEPEPGRSGGDSGPPKKGRTQLVLGAAVVVLVIALAILVMTRT